MTGTTQQTPSERDHAGLSHPSRRSTSQKIGLWLGPILFFVTLLFDLQPGEPAVTRMAAVALLMAAWWISDAIPLFATALLPLILFPLLGIERTGATAPVYFNSTIVLFVGGFMIALTMEKWDVHRRIALWIISRVGGGARRIVLGFMIAAAFLSMWISNTATAIMMIPIGLAVVLRMEEDFGEARTHAFSVSLMLAIAYACSAGGLATLVGTPPNLSLQRIFAISFPDAPAITFGQWILMGLPMSIVLIIIAWLLLTRVFFRVPDEVSVDGEALNEEKAKLGPVAFEERAVLIVFALTAVLWVFRAPIDIGALTIPGWSQLLPYGSLIDDATVAITMASILFLVPTRSEGATSATVMGPDVLPRLPWNIVLLFGGGFALAHGFQVTGLAEFLGGKFMGLASVPPLLLILMICLGITFLTELTSNTATTEMVLPVLASVGVATGIHPLLLMIPATISASCAFMMPVATPPNAVVFGSERVRIAEMARVGVVLNVVGALVITLIFYTLGTLLFEIELGVLPDWATSGG
ncbi:MAG: SLC13 family permease [Gemmatimonadota bacterium]|nr:SLC13 family permease [Gemmatimonadota bacterium]